MIRKAPKWTISQTWRKNQKQTDEDNLDRNINQR
jgi:hypothetical protein